jgi:hypothetical protein
MQLNIIISNTHASMVLLDDKRPTEMDLIVDSFRPERTETIVVHGCATIFNGNKP